VDVAKCHEKILALIKPGETIQRAIQRLGKSSKKYKIATLSKAKKAELPSDVLEERDQMLDLTSIANDLLLSGDMNVYEKTYEQLAHLLKEGQKANSMDMFSEDNVEVSKDKATDEANDVTWEFKWENKDDAQIFGPNTNEQMKKWVGEGYFESGVWVRQIGKSDSQFYTSKRIDFDLYS
jgi:CD2 antigen cytoplasmic tail-binding protein 2